MPELFIPVLLFIIAFLYASVGHGGASGYIAVLSIFSIPLAQYKPVVLTLNIIIAAIAFAQFYRAGYFRWKLAWPFLICSIPFAFLGSHFKTPEHIYNIILGIALIFPVARLLGKAPQQKEHLQELPLANAMFWGALIGFVSGFLNIGGGIFLSPVIVLFAWGNAKQAAAVSSLFIVCNSMAGLAAVTFSNTLINITTISWLLAALAGGMAGAYLGSHKYQLSTVRYLLSAVLSIAAVKLIIDGIAH